MHLCRQSCTQVTLEQRHPSSRILPAQLILHNYCSNIPSLFNYVVQLLLPLATTALPFVTEAQRQHGLRHEDYERYRRYCAQRLKRIRKCLKFTQGRKSHVKKVLISDNVKDVRFLHIPLVLAERAWAFFMQLKEESKTDERKKFHMVRCCSFNF